MRTSILLLLTTTALCAQPTNFEVASLKRVEPAEMARLAAAECGGHDTGVRVGWWGGPGTGDPARFTAQYVSLARLVSRAYDLKPYQFGPPEWMTVERYVLNANIARGVTEEQFRLMLQNLLAERLDLKVHWETKVGSAQEFDGRPISGHFSKNDEFGLKGRHPLSLEKQVS
jgi:uncharacterized protein (TIGR03435 family)